MELPSTDTRVYCHTILSNGLHCLLIHDVEADKAAAAVSVRVGQLHDDTSWPGLAHLTEHLVFMGTTKYPDENEYDRYLSAAGGHSNAYTDLELTCYYMDCQNSQLDGALDRFASSLSCPLLQASSLEREIQAVDSEHVKNVQSDYWRLNQLTRTILGHHHPYAIFGSGNKESLAAHDIPSLRNAVQAFFDRYYKANNMTLCITGQDSIEQLQNLAETYFAAIPPGTEANVPPTLSALTPSLPWRVHAVPIREHVTVELQWPLRETMSLYESKPTRFLSHLLGHEGPGSLLMALRDKHWAQELVADDLSRSCREFSIFTLELELTDAGLQHLDQVVTMVYAYLALLHDIPDWVYDELKATSDMQFRFLSKRPPADTVSSLAVQMLQYPPERYVSGPYKLFIDAHPKEAIQECWKYLTPDNMLMLVSAREFEGTTDQTDRWYGTKFRHVELNPTALDQWRSPDSDKELIASLRLPDLNDMLATEFDLVEPLSEFRDNAVPRCLIDSATCRLWYKPDTVFGQPKVNIMALLRSSIAYAASPTHSVLASLWVEFLKEYCNEFAYAASMAGLHCDFHNSRLGMEVHVSGYNHKAGILLKRIVDAVQSMSDALSDEMFLRIVHKIKTQFSSFFVSPPYQHAIFAGDLCLEDTKWDMHARMECLGDISREDLTSFSKALLSRFRVEMFVHGNVSPSQAKAFSDMLLDGWKPKTPLQLPTLRVSKLESEALYRFRGWNDDDQNSCAMNVYQVGPVDVRTNAVLSLTHHLLQEPAFNQLRTEEQLGYIVHTGIKTNGERIKGWFCLVQSDSFAPPHIDSRIEVFLSNFRSKLVDMTDDDFAMNLESVHRNLLEKNKSLGEESSKHWNVITNQTYRFKRLQEIAEQVEGLSKTDVLQFYDRYMLVDSPHRQKLSVQICGSNHTDCLKEAVGSSVVIITDPTEFRRGLSLFPSQVNVDIEELKLSFGVSS